LRSSNDNVNKGKTMVDVKSAQARPAPPMPFEKPSPGSWVLDASHWERPMPRILQGVFEESYTEGNRESAKAYGVAFDTMEFATVNGFPYYCERQLGGPKEPKGLPPKWLLKLMLRIEPGLRRRVRSCDAAFATRRWREDIRRYLEDEVPPVVKRASELKQVKLDAQGDRALADHVARARQLLKDDLRIHFRFNVGRVLPVGDFVAQVRSWIDVPVAEILASLRGFSPASEEGLAELEALAARLRTDEILARRLRENDADPAALIAELRGRQDDTGEATRAWLDCVGARVTGFCAGYPTLQETPSTLVASLRAALDAPAREDAEAAGRAAEARLRAKIPDEHRATFNALLDEARSVYFLRDHMTMRNTTSFGLLRLAALEVGRRMVSQGLIDEAEAALDLQFDEVRGLLVEGRTPDLASMRQWYAWRQVATTAMAPASLGPPAPPFPPLDWFPPGMARQLAALLAYDEAMLGEVEPERPEPTLVKGNGASPGVRVGTARLVLEPGDFDRVQPGDILVARITTPSYNVLLPMLAGIVTDRGGILSHPAIVSREYGIPGVVGARGATERIPDGARVEIDGDAGTVRLL
jgi:rifampicin phosphotransferase